ncbi:MAG: glycosyltransferase family 4 protein, partial [Campylobacteraceae bacterium]|nr:glycosyltransferase family 4 protein [Campylobacteraceae bacterium]
GSMADLPKHAAKIISDDFNEDDLISTLEELYENEALRNQLGKNAKDSINTLHNPDICAAMYKDTIEGFYQLEHQGYKKLIDSLASEISINDETLSKNILLKPRQKQLFIDISELVQRDAKSGIQRVVRAILKELLINPPRGYKVEPIYADVQTLGYKYARQFTANFLNIPISFKDEPIDFYEGDIFLGLDLQPLVVPFQKDFLVSMRNFGVKVYFVIYDLLCINKPEFFVHGAYEGFEKWLNIVLENDGVICISKAVSEEVKAYIQVQNIKTKKDFLIDWFHLGADIDKSNPSKGFPQNTDEVLNKLKATKTFLMVGTIEPRKGNRLTLEAFEKLWNSGANINLVIVGKQGWMMDDFIDKIKDHTELNKKLFWLDGISDEYLEKVYEASTCLIAVSEGEGFGLPLIEAAQYKKPIIARDIPVFREVAGDFAYYFYNSNDSAVLEKAIVEWLEMYKNNEHPKSDEMPWLTWKESKENLINRILK